ncbi:WS/DGAT/MGAT family O-acyltransferase [Nakamurella deserti]|uniref:WS/DGAT/MGAT family O-acyltransferase n=1 Tax=Nakamurella deserti TaxID=2164074 RepID=UPI000DBE5715|nr:wax ester/triacylglycerol synthase family O-acyltransferase [Nakamurella deserti]
MTDRLSPADAGFLYTEDATTPMHVGGVVILQPTGPFDYTAIVELVEARLSLVPRYRQKVRFVPGRFARPVWVDDEDFDLMYHVRRSALAKPGSDAQLADLVGRLISRPLDRSRPLWELYVVEGLSDGRVALINKTHHAMVDRMGAVDVAAAILDLTPQPRPVTERPWLPTPAPSDIDLVVDAVVDISTRPAEVVDAVRLAALDVRATVDGVGRTLAGMWHVARRAVRPAPRSMLNVPVSGARRFAGVSVDLRRLKTIQDTHGGTINDIILTLIAGALRSFLVSRGEPVLPGTTLRALVPVSVRTAADTAAPVESYLIDLPVSEPNPVIRLHQVSFAMAGHTESGQSVAADSLMELGRFAPSTLHILGARVGSQLGRRLYNLLVTNVPGPQVPLYAAGIPVDAMYPVAPLSQGQTLAVSVTSYNGRVFFGLTADRDAMPDLDDFGPLLQEAVDEFPATATRRATRPAPAGTATPTTRSTANAPKQEPTATSAASPAVADALAAPTAPRAAPRPREVSDAVGAPPAAAPRRASRRAGPPDGAATPAAVRSSRASRTAGSSDGAATAAGPRSARASRTNGSSDGGASSAAGARSSRESRTTPSDASAAPAAGPGSVRARAATAPTDGAGATGASSEEASAGSAATLSATPADALRGVAAPVDARLAVTAPPGVSPDVATPANALPAAATPAAATPAAATPANDTPANDTPASATPAAATPAAATPANDTPADAVPSDATHDDDVPAVAPSSDPEARPGPTSTDPRPGARAPRRRTGSPRPAPRPAPPHPTPAATADTAAATTPDPPHPIPEAETAE